MLAPRHPGAAAAPGSPPAAPFVLYFPRLDQRLRFLGAVSIPAGSFQMGCDLLDDPDCKPAQSPRHTIRLSAYRLDRYEVTNARYALCVAAGACAPPWEAGSFTRAAYYAEPAYTDFPVVSVDWGQASDFCAWSGGRLPSEAEWERAARGDADARLYPWGATARDCTRLNFLAPAGPCLGDTARVGSYPAGASPWGALDMAGNVWEWVADWFDPAYYSQYPVDGWPADPKGPEKGKYKGVRGGSWDKDAVSVRLARRQSSVPTGYDRSSGFRCAY